MNPLISIIIPVYNHASVLERCLLSIFAQTYRPIEIIIVNDGSTDNFANVIKKFQIANQAQNLKILNQENKGAPTARNMGFRESKGDYVTFWDADTIAKPDMLEKMFLILRDNPAVSYVYSQFKFGWKKMKSNIFDANLLKQVNYIDTTSLIRRCDFPTVGWDESLKRFQDWDLWLTMLENKKTGMFIPEVLFKKMVGTRKGISRWLPSFIYKLPWKVKRALKYEDVRQIILKKHYNH